MYTKFHGTNGQTAARWLRTIELEIPFKSGRHPYKWLESVDGLLIGDAACWADQHPKVKKLLTEENIKHATIYDVDTFIALFLERFAPLEKDCMLDISAKLKDLRQKPAENLEDYYRRTQDLLYGLQGVGNPSGGPVDEVNQRLEHEAIKYYLLGLEDTSLPRILAYNVGNDALGAQFLTLLDAFKASRIRSLAKKDERWQYG